jgi:type VI secretion system protein ImpE
MNAAEFFQAGQLSQAIAAQVEEVKKHPTDAARRFFLAELLCLHGDVERADKQLDALATQQPEAAVGLALFRQLVRAEQARRDFYDAGRVPEFLDEPTAAIKLHLQAWIELREGNAGRAAELLAQADEERPKPSGTCDGQPFADFRDLDDLSASFVEVLTSTGKYYWIPTERIALMEFHPPESPRDLLWRRVHMIVSGGPDGEVFVPAIYVQSYTDPDERVRLGRVTDWRGGDGEPCRGLGQRTFLVGEEDRPVMALEEVVFEQGQ